MTEQDYRNLLKNRLIEYRDTLNLPENVSFGVEIEYENIATDTVTHLLTEELFFNTGLKGWFSKRELDLSEYNDKIKENMNGEISSPILKDNIDTWKNLKIVLDLLNKNDALVTQKCGGHVNIGAHILGENQKYWRNFFLLWLLYEQEIYKFSSGEYLKVRQRNDDTINNSSILLKRCIDFIANNYDGIYEDLNEHAEQLFIKHCDISIPRQHILSNLIKENNRIEFRIPNGTLSEEIWQNYINFFAKFVIACKKELDVEKVLYRIKNKESSAIELADYIFDDDIDKEYFLMQVLKTDKVYKKELPEHIMYY